MRHRWHSWHYKFTWLSEADPRYSLPGAWICSRCGVTADSRVTHFTDGRGFQHDVREMPARRVSPESFLSPDSSFREFSADRDAAVAEWLSKPEVG